ncbi:nucleotidyltransferase [Nanobdella aerobiophila]|uniref:Nucleotidyltransferase n=1 Tax=Nanobdella aerobiophila TaxID=2586965 RepID=A0A915WRE5_9ARCH|nr:nucleotidyltransferase domain-containing protein [Nanobdella aerobiophila]BBL45498.1 nucleotidyltransferase [Nanobdella aerobiophila]
MEDINNIIINFSKDLIEKVDGLVKTIALFGSYAQNKENKKSDIDILILIDDIYANDLNISIPFYFDNLNKILSKEEYKKIHPTTLTLTKFWNMILNGDPLILDILRKSNVIFDSSGIYGSLKRMLENGMIKTSPEYLETMRNKSQELYNYSYFLINKSFESLYNSVIYLIQYYLIKNKINVYSPEDIVEKLEELKKNKKIKKDIVEYFREIYDTMKRLEHKDIDKIDLDNFNKLLNKYIDFKEMIEKL